VQHGMHLQVAATKDQNENQPQNCAESSPSSDVVTELFIGLPDTRTNLGLSNQV